MAQAFASDPAGGDGLVGRMEPVEVELVVDALRQVHELVNGDAGTKPDGSGEDDLFASWAASMQEREAPTDPALRRLFPDGNTSDEDASREFRRLIEGSIRRQKAGNLSVAVDAFSRALGEQRAVDVALTRPEARAVMMALTDVRLVLAERLGLHTDADAEELHDLVNTLQAPRDPHELTAMYYDFITWLAESLTVAYMGHG